MPAINAAECRSRKADFALLDKPSAGVMQNLRLCQADSDRLDTMIGTTRFAGKLPQMLRQNSNCRSKGATCAQLASVGLNQAATGKVSSRLAGAVY